MIKIIMPLLLGTFLFGSLPVPQQFRADFNQTVINTDNNQTLHYSGHVAIKVPNRAKWVYSRPVPKTICLLEDRAWVIEPELEQATLYRLDKAIPLLAILENAKKIDTGHYTARYNGVEYDLRVDEKEKLKAVEYTDELGNRVILLFSGIDTSPIDSTETECTIPREYDVIDGRF
ncbi:LolA-like outer membrane lipoprotein chaperone [Hydrogenimonas sp.]|uniref:LolA-like outer membrane lipoprotein chaperone n=1 Tax=Hydrogenimonas sp. TaxID=2231112 RepID=UPI00260E616C|nr:LolA-like outer membrane lipoprotein chaperone [Hydrogenimonas sp.]